MVNAVLVETERSCILVDAGFAPRVLKHRLAVAGVAPESIAVIVTSVGEGSRAGIVYDLGHVTESVSRAL